MPVNNIQRRRKAQEELIVPPDAKWAFSAREREIIRLASLAKGSLGYFNPKSGKTYQEATVRADVEITALANAAIDAVRGLDQWADLAERGVIGILPERTGKRRKRGAGEKSLPA